MCEGGYFNHKHEVTYNMADQRQGHGRQQNNRRGRGRSGGGNNNNNNNRRQNPLTRNIDSNGPEIKVRGTISHVFEKYQSLANDAQVMSEHIAAENYLQHAEHYYRLMNEYQAQQQQQQQQKNNQEAQRDDQSNIQKASDGSPLPEAEVPSEDKNGARVLEAESTDQMETAEPATPAAEPAKAEDAEPVEAETEVTSEEAAPRKRKPRTRKRAAPKADADKDQGAAPEETSETDQVPA